MTKILLCLLFISSLSFSQTKISGTVTDKNDEPLQSANVYLKNTYDGASTNEQGKYSFSTDETGEQTLVVSFIGYQTKETKINLNGKELAVDVVLEETASSTNTVVISAGAFEASDENKSVILKPLDILTTGSTADIYTAINTLPGTQQIGETEGLFVRGGSAAETKTIIDEMIVQKPFYSTVPDVASRGRFSPQLFKGTLFSTGGYSAQYGQALSSTLILKSTDLAPDTRSAINIMSVGLGGSHIQRWENTSLSTEVGYYNLTPYYKIQKDRFEWSKIPETAEGQVVFRHKTSETGIFKVYSSFSDSYMKLFLNNLDNLSQKDLYGLRNDNFFMNSSYSDILGNEWTFFSGISYSSGINNIEINSDKITAYYRWFIFNIRRRSKQADVQRYL
jgi:vitamin B12 transporter